MPERAISSSSEEIESNEKETPSNDATKENKNDQLGRVGNKDWCKCGQCKRETREIDSLCCTEVPAIIEDKFEGKKYYFSTQIWIAVFKKDNFKIHFNWFPWNWRRSPRKS